jgi:aspartyl-tRNA(Asn)/glutamyl-tRNA(Gln) amidotransferase subunit B
MPRELVDELGLTTVKDSSFIEDLIRDVLGNFPDKVQEYKNGKVGLIGLFVGEVMKKSQGKADPKSTNELVRKILDEA